MMENKEHESVLKQEAVEALHIKPDGIYVDCTLGRAGHAQAIVNQLGENGLLVGLDQDSAAIEAAQQLLPEHKTLLIRTNFREMKEALADHGITEVDGILFDLGVSSPQLDEGERGFSYQHEAKLDMRMDQRQPLTAYDIVNDWPYEQLIYIFFAYGEEKFSKQIARAIERAREKQPIETTYELVDLIKEAIPAPARRKGGHPAKRIFQALRIAVNDELKSFVQALHEAADILSIQGRIAVITFHSLEDRICKQAFQKWSTEKPVPKGLPMIPEGFEAPFKRITRKPILPQAEEIERNRRARSAKLRVVEKLKAWDHTFTYEEGWKAR